MKGETTVFKNNYTTICTPVETDFYIWMASVARRGVGSKMMGRRLGAELRETRMIKKERPKGKIEK
jgi:hypothetical protein